MERTFPKSIVAVGFAVLHDAAVYLVDVLEATLFHEDTEDFAADAAGTICHDLLVFDVIIFVALDLAQEVCSGARIRHDSIFERTDRRLIGITPIKEYDVLAMLFDQLVDLVRLKVFSGADDA